MAAPITVNLFRDTLDLVRLYNSSQAFKSSFNRLLDNPRVTYLGRPLKDYVYVMTKVTPQYKIIFQQGLTKDHVSDLLQDFYFNKYGFNVLTKEYMALQNGVAEQPTFLTEPEHQELVNKEEGLEKARKRDAVGGAISRDSTFVSGQNSGTGSGIGVTNRDGLAVSGINSGTGSGTAATNKKFQTIGRLSRIPNEIKPLISKVPYPVKNFLSNVISNVSINFVRFRAEHDVMDKTIISGAIVGGITSLLTGSPTIGAMAGLGTGTAVNIAMTRQKNEQEENQALSNMTSGDNESGDETGFGSSNSSGGGSSGGRGNFNLRNRAVRKIANKLRDNLGRKAADAAAKRGLMLLLANPEIWIPVAIVLLVIIGIPLLVIFFKTNKEAALFPPWHQTSTTSPTVGKSLTITKTGTAEVANGQDITYVITVTYTGVGTADIEVTDQIPTNTTFKSAAPDVAPAGNIVKWKLGGVLPNQPHKLSFNATPTVPDIWVTNVAEAAITSVKSPAYSGGNIAGLLPNPMLPSSENWEQRRAQILARVNIANPAPYKEASALTGVPWEVLVGLHFVETGGSLSQTNSLVSGRAIGAIEPDVPRSACSGGDYKPGRPVPIGGSCGFNTFLDSVIYAANHIKEKIGKTPESFSDIVSAVSRYNGGGNSNCGKTPYTGCPPEFDGEDDAYAMNYFDSKHSDMYLVYCVDVTRCNPPRLLGRPGVMSVIRAIVEQ